MALTPDAQGNYRPPGPQNPSKYPFVGNAYRRYGEQIGFIYDPYSDKYKPDPKVAQQYYEGAGLIEKPKEPPSLSDTLVPIAGVGAALAGGRYLGENIGDIGKGLLSAGKNALGYGAETTAATAAEGGASALAGAAPELMGPPTAAEMMGPNLPAETGFFNMGGGLVNGEITPMSGAAGVAGLLGAYDVLSNKKHGASGAFEGAGAGAGIGTMIAPGIGTAIGAGIGGLIGYFGNFGDVDAYKTEWKRKKNLFDQGLITEAELGPEPVKGRSKEELVEEARRMGGNVEFAQTRDESKLTPADIQGYATIIEEASKRGVDRMTLAQQALAAGAVSEHHGTIDVDWGKVGQPQQPQAGLLTPMPPKSSTSWGNIPGLPDMSEAVNLTGGIAAPTTALPIQRPVTNAGLLSTRT